MLSLRDHRSDGYGLNCEALPNSQKAAALTGSAYFFTGKPCRHGHVSSRYTKGGSCSLCTRMGNARRSGRDVEDIAPKVRANKVRLASFGSGEITYIPAAPCRAGHLLRWVSSNNCVECDRLARKRHKESRDNARYKKLYGLSAEAHEELFQSQGCACAICSSAFASRKLMHVDHCHSTGRVRALLCSKCNQAIGLFNDNPALMLRAAEYVNAFAS